MKKNLEKCCRKAYDIVRMSETIYTLSSVTANSFCPVLQGGVESDEFYKAMAKVSLRESEELHKQIHELHLMILDCLNKIENGEKEETE